MLDEQHPAAPTLGTLKAQPGPPHVPHTAKQHAVPVWTPTNPLLQVEPVVLQAKEGRRSLCVSLYRTPPEEPGNFRFLGLMRSELVHSVSA